MPLGDSEGLHVHALSKTFGSRVAVDNVSFTVSPGEVFGLLGPNGAGKTTTVRMLTGLLRSTSGTASVADVELPLKDDGVALRSRVGLLTESPGLYDRLTALENLRFYMRLHSLKESDCWKSTETLLERFELASRVHEPVGGFSKGMRQKLAIVRTLLHQPQVLFFDEPTSGLDPLSAKVVREVIAEQAAQGKTVVLCSHNLPEVERLCGSVAVIKTKLRLLTSLQTLASGAVAFELRVAGQVQAAAALVHPVVAVEEVREADNVMVVTLSQESDAPALLKRLVALPIDLLEFRRASHQLERAYLQVVSEAQA
jgi:ABC-2 type transport system ATP-binding protein